jgi:thiol-disulfide isomerase/thioredoxin
MKTEDKILVGKIYADWCGHCKDLKPEWDKMKKSLEENAKSLGLIIEFVEIEQSEKQKLEDFKKSNPDLQENGYPTIFKKKNGGKMEHYDGPRGSNDLVNWVLNDDSGNKKMGGKTKKTKTTKKKKSQRKKKSQQKKKKRAKTSKNRISQFTSLFSFGK